MINLKTEFEGSLKRPGAKITRSTVKVWARVQNNNRLAAAAVSFSTLAGDFSPKN